MPRRHFGTFTGGIDLPDDKEWRKLRLEHVRAKPEGRGLQGRVRVIKLAKRKAGVVTASCRAIRRLMEAYPHRAKHDGLIMLQDDVVFNINWRARLRETLRKLRNARPPVGVLCGLRLNTPIAGRPLGPLLVARGGVTAQCYFLTPRGLRAIHPWICQQHKEKKGFDNMLCANVRTGGGGVYLMNPGVGQHIGIVSTVRGWKWCWRSPKGRVCYQSKGPYPLAGDVRKFE